MAQPDEILAANTLCLLRQVLTLADPITDAEIDQRVAEQHRLFFMQQSAVPQDQLTKWSIARRLGRCSPKFQRKVAYSFLYQERQQNMLGVFSEVVGFDFPNLIPGGNRVTRYLTHEEVTNIKRQNVPIFGLTK